MPKFKVGEKVVFTGATESSDTQKTFDLIVGRIYTVRSIHIHRFVTNIHLEETSGTFDEDWFEEA